MCQQNCIGRWIWKSGELKNAYAIPWEIQSCNTNPDNFLWEKDKTSILTLLVIDRFRNIDKISYVKCPTIFIQFS